MFTHCRFLTPLNTFDLGLYKSVRFRRRQCELHIIECIFKYHWSLFRRVSFQGVTIDLVNRSPMSIFSLTVILSLHSLCLWKLLFILSAQIRGFQFQQLAGQSDVFHTRKSSSWLCDTPQFNDLLQQLNKRDTVASIIGRVRLLFGYTNLEWVAMMSHLPSMSACPVSLNNANNAYNNSNNNNNNTAIIKWYWRLKWRTEIIFESILVGWIFILEYNGVAQNYNNNLMPCLLLCISVLFYRYCHYTSYIFTSNWLDYSKR